MTLEQLIQRLKELSDRIDKIEGASEKEIQQLQEDAAELHDEVLEFGIVEAEE